MREIRCEVEIQSSPEAVWAILVDLPQHQEWNSTYPRWEGQIAENARIEIHYVGPSRTLVFHPLVTEVKPARKLTYVGHLGADFLLHTTHSCELIPTETGCRFLQREEFRGLLVPLLWKTLDRDARNGFLKMNQDLKARAEAQPTGA